MFTGFLSVPSHCSEWLMDDDGSEADSEVSRGGLAQKDASKTQKRKKNNLIYLDRYVKYRKPSYGNVLSKVECKHFNPILIF